jgi:iron complex transport system substrate-binding protein
MLLALGLRDRMAGYSGISGWKTLDASMREALGGLAELAARYPSLENLLDANADFLFAGWSYGMQVGGPVTPQRLAPFGIAVYELSESCSRIMPRPPARLDDLYTDLENLGRIFDVAPRAQALITQLRQRVARVTTALADVHAKPRVFSTTAAKTARPPAAWACLRR